MNFCRYSIAFIPLWFTYFWVHVFLFQVASIYALAVFEDYLYATHLHPSGGSPTVELLQIHRFNITAGSRILVSPGNTRGLRVYHKLTQPKGKIHFILKLARHRNTILYWYVWMKIQFLPITMSITIQYFWFHLIQEPVIYMKWHHLPI